jgi:Autoinducer binding domain
MPGGDLEHFANRVARCKSRDELFLIFRAAVEAEGFQNIAFSQLGTDAGFEIPYLEVPDGAAGAYFSENFAENDPVLAAARLKTSPFTWSDAARRCDLSKPAWAVMEACRDLGMHSGLTIPLHGPGNRCDLFSLSLRDQRSIDPASYTIVAMKSYAVWLRYYELGAQEQIASLDDDLFSADHRDGLSKISRDECEALVVADVSHRRYRAGLHEMNDKLTSILGDEMFDRLQRRGLLYDEPDDLRWRFLARPSPIARSHLKTCSAVQSMRDQIWQLHVRMDERPGV